MNSFVKFVLALSVGIHAAGQEWTRFRGPNGSGISTEKSIPTHVSDALLSWKVELPGVGHSSPVLWGDKLFITTSGDDQGGFSASCLDANDGRTIWKKDFPLRPFRRHKFNSFASSTPAVDAERVYILFNEPGRFMLAALDHQGKTIWERDLGPFLSQHGSAISPIVHDGLVIVGNEQGDSNSIKENAKAKSFILAVNARDGKTVWQTPRETLSVAYSTPSVYEKDGTKALIFNSEAHGIYAVNPSDGKVLWEFDKAFDKRCVSSPVITGDIILGSCGSGGGGSFVTAIRAPKTGGEPMLAYNVRKSAPYVPTPVAVGKLAWLWSDAGVLTCIDVENGEAKYVERVGGNFFGSPIWVDGRLFAVSTSGELVVVEASDKFNVLHRYPLGELCHTTPAVARGRLFVRTEKHLWCFGGSKPANRL
jgi:outer membrane protein assembly factor BamB